MSQMPTRAARVYRALDAPCYRTAVSTSRTESPGGRGGSEGSGLGCPLAFLGENRLGNGAQAFGQIVELADVVGVEGPVAGAAPAYPDLRDGGRRLRRRRTGELVEPPDLLGRQRMWSTASSTMGRTSPDRPRR